ncbi:lytic transglycosylase domain-containing protein [Bradyrhizobium sp. ORS 111]|uniref:lytic transglycosylase domain-containing protein n=1 Tax=Bradyrhizobium sp. ORS 111 TaxID=1685958 RepID=UPI00388F75B5
MRFELGQIATSGGLGRGSNFLFKLLAHAAIAAMVAPAAVASDAAHHSPVVQEQPSAGNDRSDPGQQPQLDRGPAPTSPAEPPTLCQALAAAARTSDLPVDFFTRLIWQESRFKPDAISPKGAQGIAQFMPTTARLSGLENPFDPLEAITKSGDLLRNLRNEFGNLGLAAAAYNAGPARVHEWLGHHRPLPLETRSYVRIITGHDVDEWAEGHSGPANMPSIVGLPCDTAGVILLEPKPDPKPWGVEVVGAPTPAKALDRYREWQPKYAAIIGDREPQVVIRGILGQMGAARVRVGEDTQSGAKRLCEALRAAGAYCDALRN